VNFTIIWFSFTYPLHLFWRWNSCRTFPLHEYLFSLNLPRSLCRFHWRPGSRINFHWCSVSSHQTFFFCGWLIFTLLCFTKMFCSFTFSFLYNFSILYCLRKRSTIKKNILYIKKSWTFLTKSLNKNDLSVYFRLQFFLSFQRQTSSSFLSGNSEVMVITDLHRFLPCHYSRW
jgi:hypothetical protein